mgnify:CR=1 FL=1|tara:strand:+ start:465211 stop:466026 length:816 start_codon:yes stop_codon:yes gene_type:complete
MDNLTFYADKLLTLIIDYSPKVLTALAVLLVGLWAIKFIIKYARKLMVKRGIEETLQKFLSNLLGWTLKALLFVTVISQLGVPATSFVAILGAAGLAVGLALQGSLANFAGGVLIMIFKPIKVGDFIKAQGEEGAVKAIEIFTTKLTSVDSKEIIIPNAALSNGTIINYSTEPIRRINFVFGVGYDSDIKKTKEVLMNIITSHPKVLKEPIPIVALSTLNDSSLDFIVRPWVLNEDYWPTYFNLTEQIKEALDAAGIDIPYPHTVEIQKQA